MIELTILLPTQVSTLQAIAVFSAVHSGHSKSSLDFGNLKFAISFVKVQLADVEGITDVVSCGVDNRDIAILFDDDLTSPKEWYVRVIDGVMTYAHQTCEDDGRRHEVVSRTRRH